MTVHERAEQVAGQRGQDSSASAGPTFGDALTLLAIAEGIKSAHALRLINPPFASFDFPPDHKALIVRVIDSHADMLAALHKARIEIGSWLARAEMPATRRAHDAVCAAIAKAESRT